MKNKRLRETLFNETKSGSMPAKRGPGFREVVIVSAMRLMPDLAHLVPDYIPELNILRMAAERAFIENLTGVDVENVRLGLKILNGTGKLEE